MDTGYDVATKGPGTYLVRVLGNNRRFVHTNHLVPEDAREQMLKGKQLKEKL